MVRINENCPVVSCEDERDCINCEIDDCEMHMYVREEEWVEEDNGVEE